MSVNWHRGFDCGAALLDRLKLETGADDLAVDLAVALGILLAEDTGAQKAKVLLSDAGALVTAAFQARRFQTDLVSDVRGHG